MEIDKSVRDSFLWKNPQYLRCYLDIGLSKSLNETLSAMSMRWGMARSSISYFLRKAEESGLIAKGKSGWYVCTSTDRETLADKQQAYMKRRNDFGQSLIPFLPEYGKDMIREFYDYWSEPNKTKTKMRWEGQKTFDISLRLKNWRRNNYGRGGKQSSRQKAIEQRNNILAYTPKQSAEERLREIEGGEDLLI